MNDIEIKCHTFEDIGIVVDTNRKLDRDGLEKIKTEAQKASSLCSRRQSIGYGEDPECPWPCALFNVAVADKRRVKQAILQARAGRVKPNSQS